jgi:hypothetical protein
VRPTPRAVILQPAKVVVAAAGKIGASAGKQPKPKPGAVEPLSPSNARAVMDAIVNSNTTWKVPVNEVRPVLSGGAGWNRRR